MIAAIVIRPMLPVSARMIWCALVLAVVAAGCGHRRFPVDGTLVFDDGTPYSDGGIIAMEMLLDGKMIMKRVPISPDGTFNARQGTTPGAIAGTYRIRIVPPSEGEVGEQLHRPLPFDKRFLSCDTSGLEWEVGSAGSSSGLVIDLGRRPASR